MRAPCRTVLLAGLLSISAAAHVVGQAQSVDGAQLMRDLETLSADAMEGRRAGTPGSARAREYLVRRFKEAGIVPLGTWYEQPFPLRRASEVEDRGGVNVVGVIRGRDAARVLVVTAHYDHIGVRNGQVYNGADDNASGVAVLLAVAARASRETPRHSILFAALDAEESGSQGARALLGSPPVPRESMVMNVNLDMVARDERNVLFASGTHHYPFLKPYLLDVAVPPVTLRFGHDVPKSPQSSSSPSEDDWTRSSDHRTFHEAGIPYIYFGVEDEAHHHKPTDDAATVTREFFIGAANTIVAAVRRFDASLDAIASRR